MFKKHILFVVFCFLTQLLIAQDGYYKNHNDYLNDRLQECEILSIGHIATDFCMDVKINGKKIRIDIDVKNMWGYKRGDLVYRIGDKNFPFEVYKKGEVYTYRSESTATSSSGHEYTSTIMRMSKGSDGEMMPITKANLKKMFKNDEKMLSEIEELKGLSSVIYFIYGLNLNDNNFPQEFLIAKKDVSEYIYFHAGIQDYIQSVQKELLKSYVKFSYIEEQQLETPGYSDALEKYSIKYKKDLSENKTLLIKIDDLHKKLKTIPKEEREVYINKHLKIPSKFKKNKR